MLDFSSVEIVIGCTCLLLAIYYYTIVPLSYWEKKNVAGPKPVPIFGNFADIMLQKTSPGEKFRDLYRAWKHEPVIGLYQGSTPVVLINDPILLKHFFIKDFTTFTDRGFVSNEKVDPLSAHLFALDGHRWKGLRNKLSPAFTSGKLRQMYHLICECADHFEEYVDNLAAKGEPIECREITAKFTTDVIGSCAFGLNLNALSSEDSEFRRMGRKVLEPSFIATLGRTIQALSPALYKFLKIRAFSREVSDFFMGNIAETIGYRKKQNVIRHDFVDLLMQIQANPEKTDFELTDNLIAAQAFVFFLAGFETSSTTISFALYELAQNQDIQDKLRDEIQDALETHNGNLPYETINELKYLDKVFQETLRKHPPVPNLLRKSVKDYTFPDTKVDIPAGTQVFVSVLGLHYDPKYYPNPEVFDPERFESKAIQARPQIVYLPFGDGPRNCIGARFANYQTKMGIIKILKNHKVSVCSKTEIPYTIDKRAILLAPVDGIYLNFTKIAEPISPNTAQL